MVLRCSLLGHDYGEPDVEREREERGSEVVVTVQEYEECSRCGDRHVISENTEVTSLSMNASEDVPADVAGSRPGHGPETEPAPHPDTATAPAGDSAVASSSAPEHNSQSASQPADDAGEFIDAETKTDPAPTDEFPTDENGDPITDDGEIIEDTDDDSADHERERERGEWPETDDIGPPVGADDEPSAWPDADDVANPNADGDSETDVGAAESDASDAAGVTDDGGGDGDGDGDSSTDDVIDADAELDPAEDDAIVLEHDSSEIESQASVTVDPEELAAEVETMDADAETGGEDAADSGTGIERADVAPTPAEERPITDDVPTEFYCPRCDYVAAEERASLRAGDICPECRKGYLGERPRH